MKGEEESLVHEMLKEHLDDISKHDGSARKRKQAPNHLPFVGTMIFKL